MGCDRLDAVEKWYEDRCETAVKARAAGRLAYDEAVAVLRAVPEFYPELEEFSPDLVGVPADSHGFWDAWGPFCETVAAAIGEASRPAAQARLIALGTAIDAHRQATDDAANTVKNLLPKEEFRDCIRLRQLELDKMRRLHLSISVRLAQLGSAASDASASAQDQQLQRAAHSQQAPSGTAEPPTAAGSSADGQHQAPVDAGQDWATWAAEQAEHGQTGQPVEPRRQPAHARGARGGQRRRSKAADGRAPRAFVDQSKHRVASGVERRSIKRKLFNLPYTGNAPSDEQDREYLQDAPLKYAKLPAGQLGFMFSQQAKPIAGMPAWVRRWCEDAIKAGQVSDILPRQFGPIHILRGGPVPVV